MDKYRKARGVNRILIVLLCLMMNATGVMAFAEDMHENVTTDGLSQYTVEFTYNDMEYVLPGNTSVPMLDILTTFGLNGEVTEVEISDKSLFSASDEAGEWIVTAHKAFNTMEWMKVTINGVVYEITVTDDASYYAKFKYNGNSYFIDSIEGTQEIPLSDIMTPLGISGSVTSASVSENQGMTVTTSALTLTKAFGSGWLKVTAEETEYQIVIESVPNTISVEYYGSLFFDKNGGSGEMILTDPLDGTRTNAVYVKKYSNYTLPDCGYNAPDGYIFDKWEIGGVRYAAGENYVFGETTTAKAIWAEKEGVHNISASYNISEGDVIIKPTKAVQGENVTVTVQPIAGKAVDSITYAYGAISNQTLAGGEDGIYTFSMPNNNTTVSVTFMDAAVTPISYVDANGDTQTCNDYKYVRSNENTWNSGWVVASKDMILDSRVTISGTVNLILMDGKTLTVTNGIQVGYGNTLNIYAQSENTGALIAGNSQNSLCAGIGGKSAGEDGYHNPNNNIWDAGTITICGGVISAQGGSHAAGIGGASDDYYINQLGKAGTITICGNADVTATAGGGGAAIGSAPGGQGGQVTISGNAKVNAIGVDNYVGAGAGIGGGRNGNCDSIVINGGTVTATCEGGKCAAIGTGSGTGKGGTILINGGTVTATATKYDGVGIGGRDVVITIDGNAHVTATGASSSAGIGGLNESSFNNEIIIKDGTVDAYAGGTTSGAAAIGSGNKSSGTTTVTISGGIVNAYGDNIYGVGIGGGNGGTESETVNINISGGTVTATGRVGIGTANASKATQSITISDGMITATSSTYNGNPGAAIGQGNNSKSSTTINISGGKVTANGIGYGIGAGANSTVTPSINLSWTHDDDEIMAISYGGTVTLEKTFVNKSNYMEVFAAGTLTDNSIIANKTLSTGNDSRIGKISSAKVYLQNDFSVVLFATFTEEPTSASMVVTMNEGETNITGTRVDGNVIKYSFTFDGISPEYIGDSFKAVLTYEVNNETYTDTLESYSVKKYCMNLLNKSDDELQSVITNNTATVAETRALLVDILYYGEEAQKYMDHNTDDLATNELSDAQKLLATVYVTPTGNDGVVSANEMLSGTKNDNVDWYSAKANLKNAASLQFYFMSTEGMDNLTVEIDGVGYAIHSAGVSDKYYVEIERMDANTFSHSYTVVFKDNGVITGRTLKYSMNTYVSRVEGNTAFGELAKRLYNYGKSASAYASN